MAIRGSLTPHSVRLVRLAATLLVFGYVLIVGGSFSATVEFRVQLFNAITAGAIALLWLGVRLRSRARIKSSGIEPAIILFVASQWIATFTSAQPRLSLEQAVSVTAWAIAFVVLCDLLTSGWPRDFVINALVVGAVIITAQLLWEVIAWFVGWVKLGSWPPVAYRAYGFLGHPNLSAGMINLMLPVVMAQAWHASTRRVRFGFATLIVLMLVAEFFTSSRAGWIGAATTIGTMAVLATPVNTTKKWLALWIARWQTMSGAIRAGISLTAAIVMVALGWALWQQTSHATHGPILESRSAIWKPAWQNFVTHPLVGGGPGLYTWFYSASNSIPPEWLAPHAHSLPLQLLGDSGLIGFGAALALFITGAILLWRRWLAAPDKLWTAAFIGGFAGFTVHHSFDYLFGTPAFTFVFIVLSALALAPDKESLWAADHHPAWLILPMAGVIGITGFSLRAAAYNDSGIQMAAKNEWAEAGQAFLDAAEADPGITLYWENAAQALTRAGKTEAALSAWQRAARDDPYWAILPATVAVLRNDPTAMEPARRLAPGSDLFALNAGAMLESSGDALNAKLAYLDALDLKPSSAHALFWQQTPLRAETLAEWQGTQSNDSSPEALGWTALAVGDTDAAINYFLQAKAQNPLSNRPYLGLARAYWAAGEETEAAFYFQAGKLLPVVKLEDTLDFYLFEGDWASAHEDRAGTIQAYTLLFSAYNDYNIDGPGSYGYPQRSWYIYHRAAVLSEVAPQFVRADITPELDARFAQLAQWLLEDGNMDTACFVLYRVYREAPVSESGKRWTEKCQ